MEDNVVPSTNFYGDLYSQASSTADAKKNPFPRELPESDAQIVTSGGLRIPVHSSILASVSPVLENIIDRPRKHKNSQKTTIRILGVPCDAVAAFVEFIYSSRCDEAKMEKYEIHLLALAHVYYVPQLKQRCIKGISQRLTIDNIVDVLQLSRLCNAPDLYVKCMKLIFTNFKAVEKTEGWKFLQHHDPWLELDILQFIDEAESRKKRARRRRQEQKIYLELSEAMDCLVHICTEGCTSVGPCDMDHAKKKKPCSKFTTCHGVQLLIRHFATCKKKVNGGCSRCRSMWQLLRLHSSICDQHDSCKVPLCRQFKLKAQQEKREDVRWKLLVKKVVTAKAFSSLSQTTKRKRLAYGLGETGEISGSMEYNN